MTDLSEQLEFLQLSADDQHRLRELEPAFSQFAREFVEAFYAHLGRFDKPAQLLTDTETVARLKEMQLDHLRTMLEAEWGEDYVDRRRRVGRAHADRGLDPEYFLGAYNQYIQFCFRAYVKQRDASTEDEIEDLLALLKVILLDIGLTLGAYFERATQDLRKALDMYWHANSELRRFAHLASHDLKTPLATMANLCDEAIDEFGQQMPEGARDLIEQARSRSFRMSKMIDELLASAVIDPTERMLDSVSLGPIVHDALERVQPELRAKGITVSLPDSWPTVVADATALREAFFNLLSNASKFAASGGDATIEVRTSQKDGESLIAIVDNGPGIPASEAERIFDPFRRLSNHENQPGSGLGLYFTRSLIAQQGGRVWVESTPGEGSTFWVALKPAAEG